MLKEKLTWTSGDEGLASMEVQPIAIISEAPVIRSVMQCLGLSGKTPAILPALWLT